MALMRLLCTISTKNISGFSTVLIKNSAASVAFRNLRNADRMQVFQRQWISSRKKTLPFEVDTTNIGKDVLVYSYKNARFYKLLTYFGGAQFLFWAYLALFSFQNLREAPDSETAADASWWRRMAAKESKYKNGISILCFFFGYIVLCISLIYPTRAVQSLWLLRGGSAIRLNTHSVLPGQKTLTVPVRNVSCLQTRTDSAAQIPMKVKGKWFFFLLDKRGKFYNTELFDFAIGLNRSIK